MPYDSYASNLEDKISRFQRWINALENADVVKQAPYVTGQFTDDVRNGILAHLKAELSAKKRQLEMHRYRNKKSGIKYYSQG